MSCERCWLRESAIICAVLDGRLSGSTPPSGVVAVACSGANQAER